MTRYNMESLEPLKESIKHWEELVFVTDVEAINIGPTACALCNKFRVWASINGNCIGCPVRQKTGLAGCKGTPYDDAEAYVIGMDNDDHDFDYETWAMKAQAELDFLRGILAEMEAQAKEEAE